MICGDHICVNNAEARKYFEENLTIEVKIIDNKKKENFDLVQLNLRKNSSDTKKISITKKTKTKDKLKILSKKEIKKIKQDIRKNDNKTKKERTSVNKKNDNKKIRKKDLRVINEGEDICKILKECNIEEISKYLIKNSKKKDFPDISLRN